MACAVGFDLGETLFTYADTPLSWVSLYRPALARVALACGVAPGIPAFERAEQILSRFNTRLHPRAGEVPAETIFREVLSTWGVDDEPAIGAAIAAFFGFFQQRVIAYPESAELLSRLRQEGIRVGALTDVPYGMPRTFVEKDLRAVKLESLIDPWLTSVEVGFRKPADAGFHLLARGLGVTGENLWFVGNEEKDMAGAVAAGATAVLIDRERRNPRWGQHHTIRSLSELIELITRRPSR